MGFIPRIYMISFSFRLENHQLPYCWCGLERAKIRIAQRLGTETRVERKRFAELFAQDNYMVKLSLTQLKVALKVHISAPGPYAMQRSAT